MIQLFSHFATTCSPGSSLLGFPTWYKYLDGNMVRSTLTNKDICTVAITGINDLWLVLAAVIEIFLRVAALLAVGFVIWGGIKFILSQGEPDKIADARTTIINALVGLVVSIAATAIVSFIAGRF